MRYLEAQRPSPQAPVLVCGDNLGRPALAGWEKAVDRLLELPGVHVLGAVREEDFRASLQRGRARVVRPMLSGLLAEEIAAQLDHRRIPFAVEPSEAFARAEGLLMEFVALLVAGRRLRDIVNAQVEERFAAERAVERELLRYVSAAHVYTVDLPASALAALVPAPGTMPAALQRLEERRDGPIAAASPQSGFRSEQALAAKLNAALAASALTAALDDLLSRSRLRPQELPRAEIEAK
jgi:hypothetical protein